MELRHLIFKFKRLNHFKQRMQSLSVLLENQKAYQHDGINNMFINTIEAVMQESFDV